MPFLDFSKPKMLDMRKKINFVYKEKGDESAQTQQPPGINNASMAASLVDNMSESWVELAPSRTSLCSSVDVNMVIVDDKDKDSRLSPISVQSPHVEFENLEQVKYKLVRDMLPPGKNTDWIWDWNSRPENYPPKTVRMIHYGSNLTTPPNSPEPDLVQQVFPEADSLFSVKLIIGSLMPNFFSFIIGAAIGFAICSKFAKNREV